MLVRGGGARGTRGSGAPDGGLAGEGQARMERAPCTEGVMVVEEAQVVVGDVAADETETQDGGRST